MPTSLQLVDPTGRPQQQLTVPQAWAEVSLQQFVDAYAPAPPAEDEAQAPPLLVESLLGLPAGTLGQLSTEQALWLSAQLAFVLDLDQMLSVALPADAVPDVGSCTFGTLLVAQQEAQAHEGRPWPAYGPYVLAAYRVEAVCGKYDEKRAAKCLAALLQEPVTETAPLCKAILDQISALATDYEPWESDVIEPTDEEEEAGSEDFVPRFGSMLSVDGAADGALIDYEKILLIGARTVLTKLLLDGARAAYRYRIQQAREAAHQNHS